MTSKSGDPLSPVRADHRLIRKLLDTFYDGKVVHLPEEYDRVAEVFRRGGGSWEKLYRGSPEDLNLLKKVLRAAYSTGAFTRAGDWD